MDTKIDRIGEENYNNEGTLMRIVGYKNANDILIEFQDEYKVKVYTTYKSFKNGNIKNPYHKSVFNIGYLGQGKYKMSEKGKHTKAYKVWTSMLERCYDPYYLNKEPTYIDCYVCKEWHNFQNFCKWWEENVYNCNNERMCLDKDILCKGNKIYSPENCIIVPQRINNLFTKSNATRGKYPIGVSWDKRINKFSANCGIYDKNENKSKVKRLGYYNSVEETFEVYKNFKEDYIKQVADEYYNIIPRELWKAMYEYEVEIDD